MKMYAYEWLNNYCNLVFKDTSISELQSNTNYYACYYYNDGIISGLSFHCYSPKNLAILKRLMPECMKALHPQHEQLSLVQETPNGFIYGFKREVSK